MFRRIRHDEAGTVSAELVIATPLLLLLIMATFQFALWYHGAHVAAAAAQEGARSARLVDGSTESARATTQSYLDQLGHDVVFDPQINVTRTTTTATVEVSARSEAVIPWMNLPIHAVSQGKIERFVAQGDDS